MQRASREGTQPRVLRLTPPPESSTLPAWYTQPLGGRPLTQKVLLLYFQAHRMEALKTVLGCIKE